MNYIPQPFDTHTIPWGTPPFGGAPCPSCGRCPTCGQGPAPYGAQPFNPWPLGQWTLEVSDGTSTGDMFVQEVRMQEVRP